MAKRLTKHRSEWANCNCHLDTKEPCPIHVIAKQNAEKIFKIMKSQPEKMRQILQEPTLSKAEKAVKDLINSSLCKSVSLCEHWLNIDFENGHRLEIDIDQVDWSRYELRVEIE